MVDAPSEADEGPNKRDPQRSGTLLTPSPPATSMMAHLNLRGYIFYKRLQIWKKPMINVMSFIKYIIQIETS